MGDSDLHRRNSLAFAVVIFLAHSVSLIAAAKTSRYPAGSDAMGLLATVLTGGQPGRKRILLWLQVLASSLLRHPIRTLRTLHPFGWARESLILLCMQTLDGHIEMRLGRPWFWPFQRMLRSRGRRIPTFIPQIGRAH